MDENDEIRTDTIEDTDCGACGRDFSVDDVHYKEIEDGGETVMNCPNCGAELIIRRTCYLYSETI